MECSAAKCWVSAGIGQRRRWSGLPTAAPCSLRDFVALVSGPPHMCESARYRNSSIGYGVPDRRSSGAAGRSTQDRLCGLCRTSGSPCRPRELPCPLRQSRNGTICCVAGWAAPAVPTSGNGRRCRRCGDSPTDCQGFLGERWLAAWLNCGTALNAVLAFRSTTSSPRRSPWFARQSAGRWRCTSTTCNYWRDARWPRGTSPRCRRAKGRRSSPSFPPYSTRSPAEACTS